MVMDLEHICRDPVSSSSSSSKIFCHSRCSPCCCYGCCAPSFLNDHTYSLLKRICHKIIKSHSRQQCRESYSVFDGGSLKDLGWKKRHSEGKVGKDLRREETDEWKLKHKNDLGPSKKSLKDSDSNDKEIKGLTRSKKGSNGKNQHSLGEGRSEAKPSQDTDASFTSKKLRKEKGRGGKDDDKGHSNTDKDGSKKSLKDEKDGEHKKENEKTNSQNKIRGAKVKNDTDKRDTNLTASGKSRKDKRQGKDDDKESGEDGDGKDPKQSGKQTGKTESKKSRKNGSRDEDDNNKDSKKGKPYMDGDNNTPSPKSKSKQREHTSDKKVFNDGEGETNEAGGKKMKNDLAGLKLKQGTIKTLKDTSKEEVHTADGSRGKSAKVTTDATEDKSIDNNLINGMVDRVDSKRKKGSYSGDSAQKLKLSSAEDKSRSDGQNELSSERESAKKGKGEKENKGDDRKEHGGATPNGSSINEQKNRRSSSQRALKLKVESKSGVRHGIRGSKNIQADGPLSRSELYMQRFLRPSRYDEVRPCDILRTQLEQRDLSRFFQCCPRTNCRMCSPCCTVPGIPCCGNFGT
ncbi:cylicin-2-like isoform X2 [Drosophila subobscura]|uniref:cylicin-2-like isoform X2 n=1 Tax=Drosophila subobscura TaxID=7241 RepID=UPI00155AC5D7|nr:cylicin-2-like isoform X2 [Drosophila subobscura]